jgi:hypothetical protein
VGRASERETQLVRVVRAGGAPVLLVAGSAPLVYRLVGLKPKKVAEFEMEPVEGDFFQAGDGSDRLVVMSPLLPADMLIYKATWAIAADNLKPVDILWVVSGSSYYGTARQEYYLWQASGPLVALSLMDVRGALASPWVAQWRSPRTTNRAILLRN